MERSEAMWTSRLWTIRVWSLTLAACILGLGSLGCQDDRDASPPDGQDPGLTSDASGDSSEGNASDVSDDPGDGEPPDVSDDTGSALPTRTLMAEPFSDPVELRIDDWGIPHIRCQGALDCFAAQGYIHAQHRFFEMDLIRRQTLGELSEIIGGFGLESDTKFRRLMTTREGEPLEDAYYQQAGDRTKAMLQAYADGVNAWLDDMRAGENDATLTKEYDNPIISADETRDWEPQDTIALYFQLAYQLSESATGDLARANRINAVEAQTGSDLFTTKPGIASNILDASGVPEAQSLTSAGGNLEAETVRGLQSRLDPYSDAIEEARRHLGQSPSLLFGPRSPTDGSNNWALNPSRTQAGNTLLANDPHLSLNNPAIWYWVELHAEASGLHVAGASIPAVPGIVVGHNEDIAWGVTTARLDLADAYLEELTPDGEAVKFQGERVEIIEREYTFDVRGRDDETRTFEWVPHHGPIISKDEANNRAVSLKWVAHEPGSDLDFLRPLMNAEDTQSALEALDPIEAINQNWVIADREGSIGWRPEADLPRRPWASSEMPNWLPLPGDGSAEWQGYVSDENIPEIVDPPEGFIATANNDIDGSYTDGDATNDGHTPWQRPPAVGHRHARIVERIQAGGDSHTVETMHDIQADTHSLHGETLVPAILEAARQADSVSGPAQKVVEALDNWNYACPTGLDGTDPEEAGKVGDETEATESIGCAAFHVLVPHLTDAVFADELKPLIEADAAPSLYAIQAPLIYVFTDPDELQRGEAYFDDTTTEDITETKSQIVAEALDAAGQQLESVFDSSDPDDWRWGRIHTVTFSSLFAQSGIDLFNNGPYVNDGGFDTIDVANPSGTVGEIDDDFSHANGPSVRFVARANSEGVEGWFQLPGGQDHHRDSEWYGSLIDEWLANEPIRLRFGPEEVEKAAVRRIRFEPVE